MISKKTIEELLSDYLNDNHFFLVEIKVSRSNDVEVYFDSVDTTVSLDDCINMSKYLEGRLDREQEDFSLTISSAGLDKPFKVPLQYKKFKGHQVDLELKDGRKVRASIIECDDENVEFEYELSVTVEGKKKKEVKKICESFPYNSINRCKVVIDF